jgi:hypothetical protein
LNIFGHQLRRGRIHPASQPAHISQLMSEAAATAVESVCPHFEFLACARRRPFKPAAAQNCNGSHRCSCITQFDFSAAQVLVREVDGWVIRFGNWAQGWSTKCRESLYFFFLELVAKRVLVLLGAK